MTAKQVAGVLGVNERTIRRAISDGRLQAKKRGGAFDVDLEAARAALVRRREPPIFQQALAESLQLLRAFGYEADAEDLERRHGLLYVAPKPEVYVA